MNRLLITICGRAGSKGFKNKNLKVFCGKPLVYYSLSAAELFCRNHPELHVDLALNTDSEDLANLVAAQYPEVVYLPRGAELSTMIGQTVSLRITEVNRARRRVVGSIKAVTYEARQAAQAEIWNNIEVGKRYTGTVKSMTSYGVFVDIGGVDGMVHISELSWSRIKNPAEVVSVGDTLDVYVISFDPEKHKISLGVKDHSCNPWDTFMNTYKVGDVANVRIVKLMTFGAFAEVVPGVDGLIHISQIADRRIEKPGDVLSEGQMVDAKITAVDEEKQKISLSIRALLNDEPAEDEE